MDYLEQAGGTDQARFDAMWDDLAGYPECDQDDDHAYDNGEGFSDEF